MSLSWQAEIWAGMKDNDISRDAIAKEIGYTPEYVSNVLNKRRNPPNAEAKFRSALENLIAKSNESRN